MLRTIWQPLVAWLAGLSLAVCLLLGPGAAAAATGAAGPAAAGALTPVELAVDQFLDALPADVLAIGSVPALKARIASGNPLLVDLRSPADFRRGHIPAAINLPLQDLVHQLEALPRDRDVVLYCTSGYRSALGVMALHLHGYERVRGFAPGFAGWTAAGQPVA
ncbi:rhodanese-like domain-containing protein [Synechococcus sp. ATX 2A4]|uniref:rhodanese-like domain-containing protein n=1 Tax=Synechococcus sp. ATX 2A4 TaxID=2823727 RepID=UPI0020CDE722|nr:rhodanese-like domain-containing protein [Synechococcus sp. ATX 2A4]